MFWLRFIALLIFGLIIPTLFAPAMAGGEEAETEPQGENVKPPEPKARPLQIEKPANPYKLPEGPSKAGWEAFLKNDLAAAEKAFTDALAQAPNDLETLEGLRAVAVSTGRYGEAQKANLRMLAASVDSPLCSLFAMRAMDALAYSESRKEFIQALAEAAEKAIPPVRATLKDFLATLYTGLDKPAEAREALKGLGYVDKWLFVTGPFGRRDANNRMERRFAPERALKDLNFRDERGVAVKTVKDAAVSLRALECRRLLPGETGITYAFTNLESEADQEVLLVFGVPNGAWASLRGVPILQETYERRFERDTPILRTQLRKGSNPLLVKLPFAADLAVRVLGTDFAPATGISVKPLDAAAQAAHEVLPLRGFLLSRESTGMPAARLLERVPEARRAAGLRELATGGYLSVAEAPWVDLAAQQENDVPTREAVARTLVGSFPDSIGPLDLGAVILAAAGRSAGHTDSRHTEEARQLRERALKLVPNAHQHLLGLFHFFTDRNLKDQAYEKIKACAEAHPQSALAQERLGQVFQERGLTVQAERQYERAAELDAAFTSALLRFHEAKGSRERARALREKLRTLGYDSPQQRFHRLLNLGQLDAAAQVIEELAKAYPDRKDEFDDLRAQLAGERGDFAAAYALKRKALEREPRDRDALNEAVDLALRLKKDDEAKQLMAGYLKLKAGDYQIRRRLRELEGASRVDWWTPYDVTVQSIDTSAFNQDKYPRSNHAWIVDFMVTRILPDLSRESYVHIAQKVLNNEGIQELSETLVRAQRQDIVFIRTLNPDGSSYQPQNVHDFDLAKSASYYKVGPGSILEHAYLTNDDAEAEEPTLNAAFNFMALDAPRAVSRWVVILPKDHKLEIRKICPELIEEKILPGPEGCIVYQWTNKQVEGIKVEPFMPGEGDREVIPLVTIESPERRFRATGWLTRRPRYFLPDAAVEQARVIAAQQQHDAARFRAIAEWVRTAIQPGKEARNIDDVWSLRSGNAGQMSELAVAMCQAVGLPVREALVNGSYNPGNLWRSKNARREWDPGYFAGFGGSGRMLVLEPSRGNDVWLQFAGQPSKYFSLDDVLDPQPGRLALTLGDEGVRIKRVLGEATGKVNASHRLSVALDERGAGHIKGTLQLFSFIGGQIRQYLDDPRRADQVREGIVRRFWPKLENPSIKVEEQENAREPLRFVYTGLVNDLAAQAEKRFFLQPFRQQAFLLELMGPPERIHDLLIRQEYSELDTAIAYECPAGHGWVEVPDDVYLCTEFGFYIADFNVKGGRLYCSRAFLVPMQRITPDKYAKFMEFLGQILEVERQRVAYAKLDFPGFTAAPRAFVSMGYASNGSEIEEKKDTEEELKKPAPGAVPPLLKTLDAGARP